MAKYATFVTSKGNIKVKLLPEHAPETVDNFIGLATGTKDWTHPRTRQHHSGEPLYSGTIFHRVIPGFMIQGGDPLGTGTGGPGYKFKDEVDGGPSFDGPGYLAMANSGPGTNGSQFFITVAPTPWLTGKHTIFGVVTEGQEVADAISLVSTRAGDRPLTDVVLEEVRIEED
ncbi:MAG TPA: peptidylprolyl isomerase [Actinomycetota bacterium]|nr:peptidylprolyl isomerase [Actinomycetota bacterium]